jgi:hypothetical protein
MSKEKSPYFSPVTVKVNIFKTIFYAEKSFKVLLMFYSSKSGKDRKPSGLGLLLIYKLLEFIAD